MTPPSPTDLHVDLDALAELASRLGHITGGLSRARETVDAYDPRLGSRRIEEALDDFLSGWRDGRKRIIGEVEELLAAVLGAAQAYEAAERTIGDAARGS